jgi:hypothetical protein
MTKYLLILIFWTTQIVGQQLDSVKFDKIFMTSCLDRLIHPTNGRYNYIIENKDNYNYITAFKSHKRKWSYSTLDLITTGDNYVNIKCIEFYKTDKRLVIRLFLDSYVDVRGKRIYHIDIDPKKGKVIDKSIAK